MFTFTTTTVVFLVAFFAVAAVSVIAGAAAVTSFLVSNHRVRVARHETIPTYYRSLALTH